MVSVSELWANLSRYLSPLTLPLMNTPGHRRARPPPPRMARRGPDLEDEGAPEGGRKLVLPRRCEHRVIAIELR